MRSKPYGMALMVVVGTMVCAGLALAQAPDAGPGGAPDPAGPRAPRAAAGARPGGAGGQGGMVQRMAGAMLLAAQGAKSEVANTQKGVDVAISAEKPEDVTRVQQGIEAGVAQVQRMAENVRGRMAGQGARAARGERELFVLLAAGDVNVSAKKTDNGMVVSLTSDKPEVVQTIQQNAPQWVAQASAREQAREELRARFEQMREKMREGAMVLAQEDVKLEVKPTDNGITVQITSTNPDVVTQIKDKLPGFFEAEKEMAGAGRNPMGGGVGPRGMRQDGPGGPAAGPRRGGPPPEAAR